MFFEKYGCVYIVIAEAMTLTVIDYFIDLFCELFSIVELLKEVRSWCGWIPMCSHVIMIGYKVVGSGGSILSL